MSIRATRKTQENRLRLARTAARLMAEDGVSGFAHARRKAADQLGIRDKGQLPSNAEIEQALQEHQRLFQASSQQRYLHHARQTAMEAMHFLRDFDPRLTGPVLSGTVTRYHPITLHLFCDDPGAVALFLLERGIPCESGERRLNFGVMRSCPMLRFMAGEQELELIVLPCKSRNQAPLSPVDGRPQARVDKARLESLLANQTAHPG